MIRLNYLIKRIIVVTIISVLLLVFAMFSTWFFVDYNVVSNDLINSFKIDYQHIGKIKIQKFPIPYLIIDSITEAEKIELNQIEIHFSLLSLLMFQPKINLVKITDAKIYLSNKECDIIYHDQLVTKLITNNIINVNLNIANLNILHEQNQESLTNFSLYKIHPLSNSRLFKGTSNIIGTFSGSFDQNKDLVNFHFNITNNNYSFRLSETYQNAQLSHGTGEYLIKNLVKALYHIVPDFNFSLRQFNQNETVLIRFDILPTKDLLQLNNITINSNAFLGNGMVCLSKNDNVTSLIKLDFPKIDFRTLIKANNITQLYNTDYGLGFILTNKSVTTNILIDQVILNNNEILNNVTFLSDLAQGVLMIKDLSGTIASSGKFQLAGNITQNSVRSIFDGKIYLQHNDLNSILNIIGCSQATVKEATPFTLSSDLKCTWIDIYLQNLLLQTNNTKVTGNITTKFIGSMPHLSAVLDFTTIDLDRKDYPIISPIIGFTKNLTENMQDNQYLNKFIPIRTISYLGNFDITIDDMIHSNSSLGKVNLLLNISPGNIQVSNLDIRKGDDYLSTSWHLIATSLKPQLNIKVNDGSVSVNFLNPKSLISFSNRLVSAFSLDKVLLKLDCILSKISQEDFILENLKFSVENDYNLLKIKDLETNIFSGKLQGAGNILLDPHTINFVYELNAIDLATLSAFLPHGLLDTYGRGSINGQFITTGDTLEKLLYNLDIQSKFIVKNTKINNFSIDSLIEKINATTYNSTYFQDDLTKALLNDQTEVNNLHGDFEMKKGIAILNNILFNTKYTSGTASLACNIYNFNMKLSSILSFYLTDITPNLSNANNQNIQTTLGIQALGNIFTPKKTANSNLLQKILDNRKPATTLPN